MPLSEDSRALLQLLLGRGQSYEDISSLLGIEPGEVKARARAALTEMGGQDPDAQAGLTDFLLGQADPIDRATAVKRLDSDPSLNQLAHRLSDQLRLIVPGARLPDLPAEEGAAAPAAQPAAGAPSASHRGVLSSSQTRLVAILVGAAVLVAVLVLVLTGAFGGGDDGDGDGNRSAASNPTPTRATLTPVGGNSGSGEFLLGRVGQSAVVNVDLSGLEPAPEGRNYWLWLYRNDRQAANLLPVTPNASGVYRQSVQVPETVLQLIAGGLTGVRVSLTGDDELKSAVDAAGRRNLPGYTGETVLSGQLTGTLVDVAEAARRQAQRQGSGADGANAGNAGGSDSGQ